VLTQEMNERLTQVGPGTPMGEAFRRYWLPAALSSEMPAPDSPPIRVRMLGENFVAFRDSRGEIGLFDAYCPHRRAPMFFGRNEEAGLRCVYHGWKFDTGGTCVDLPSEGPQSVLKTRVSIGAYPVHEAGGVVWTYLGPRADLPPLPDYEWLRAPDTHRKVSKVYEHCNYLQAVEGGIDTVHSSFAHNNDLSERSLLRQRDTHPKLEVEATPYGFRYASVRRIAEDETYVRVYQFLLPSHQLRGGQVKLTGGRQGTPLVKGHFWVPMDDESTCIFNLSYSADQERPLTDDLWSQAEKSAGRGPDDYREGSFWLRRDASNDYLIDREVQRTRTFTGIEGVNTQDFALQEGMGPICDRTREHLGTSDRAIQAARRLLREVTDEVAEGRPPRGSDPSQYRSVRAADVILPADLPWQAAMKDDLTAVW
jgi:phthalate 4,5-dioxygenase oxygenase subunit